MIGYGEMILRLGLAIILGGVIGFEREYKNRPAGLRTHILVAVGSALIMLISMYGFEGGDPARLAAQAVSGIGFLGAGTILREGNSIRGLTTAASVWVTCGIGLALGNGYYVGAVITTFFVVFCLITLGIVENRGYISKYHKVEMKCIERPGLLGEIGSCFAGYDISIKNIKMKNISEEDDDEEQEILIVLLLKIPMNFSIEELVLSLKGIKDVKSITYFGTKSSNKQEIRL